jgi:hypothetical protein
MEPAATPSADSEGISVCHDTQKDRLLFEDIIPEEDKDSHCPAQRKAWTAETWNYAAYLSARWWKPTLVAYGAIHLIVAAALDFRRSMMYHIFYICCLCCTCFVNIVTRLILAWSCMQHVLREHLLLSSCSVLQSTYT